MAHNAYKQRRKKFVLWKERSILQNAYFHFDIQFMQMVEN